MYAIVGGVSGASQGAVITRAMDDTVYFDINYDRWEPDPPNDNRRTVAENLLSTWQRDDDTSTITIGANLMAVMSSWTVHNADTYYTGIFCPALDVFLAYGRLPVSQLTPSSDCL